MSSRESPSLRETPGVREPLAQGVFRQLQDGQFHSGAALARALGVSRGGVWKAVHMLVDAGATIDAVSNRGYRLRQPTGALDAAVIRSHLASAASKSLAGLEATWTIDSTNAALLARSDLRAGTCVALLAENQTAGRGRRGRSWLAPVGGSLCLSLGYGFAELPREIGALSLAVGVCSLRALRRCGITTAQLKWPNDLVAAGSKLGGILIEMRAESAGPIYVVIGIGLNVSLNAASRSQVTATGTNPTDLTALGLIDTDRNIVAAALLDELIAGLREFARSGLESFGAEWRGADALHGRDVAVMLADRQTRGVARGIDAAGALIVETPRGLTKFIAGEVTVRAQS